MRPRGHEDAVNLHIKRAFEVSACARGDPETVLLRTSWQSDEGQGGGVARDGMVFVLSWAEHRVH